MKDYEQDSAALYNLQGNLFKKRFSENLNNFPEICTTE